MSALREALQGLPDSVFADVLESNDAYLFVLDVPGATRETVDVRVEDSTLRIEARREKTVPEGFRYTEEDRSLFLDADIRLPPDVRGVEASAAVERGVLEVRLPKRAGAEAREIPVETPDAEE